MGAAVELIRRHVDAGGRIVVHGDYDVDGVCATAVLVRALRSLGPSGWYLPSRSDDGYGLSVATVERLARRGTGLLITVDCGITAVDEVAAARAAGIDVVLTDHHPPRRDGQLPACASSTRRRGATRARPVRDRGSRRSSPRRSARRPRGGPRAGGLATVADLMPSRREPSARREGLRAAGRHRPTRAAGAAGGLARRPSGARRARPRLPPGAADQRRRPAAPGRRGARIAADRRSRARQGDRRRARRLNAERRAVEQRIGWEAEALVGRVGERSAYVLAGEGWHGGRDRDRRLARGRALPPAGDPDRARRRRSEGPAQGRGAASPASTCWGRCDARRRHCSATGVTGRRPG